MKRLLAKYLLLSVALWCTQAWATSPKPVEITFWHSMAGQLGDQLRTVAQQFNESQSNYKVTPVFKGDYTESLTSFSAAFRAGRPPSLIQVFEVGTSSLIHPKGIIKPVAQLMAEQGKSIPVTQFFPAVLGQYSDGGQLVALPFNISIPVMYYNQTALEQIGISPDQFPRTWGELEKLSKRLHEAGYLCAYTTAYPAWTLIESYSSLHGLPMVEPDLGEAAYSNMAVLNHIKRLRRWQKKHYFEYGGRVDDATVLFTSGRCPIFSQSSGGYASLVSLVPFKVGVAPMPLDETVTSVRHNNVIGGGAIWVTSGQSSEVEQGISQFIEFLSNEKNQVYWYEHTGYLPLEPAKIHLISETKGGILSIAINDLMYQSELKKPTFRGPENQIRLINDQMLEAIFSGMLKPSDAMERSVKRANHALRRFRRNTQS